MRLGDLFITEVIILMYRINTSSIYPEYQNKPELQICFTNNKYVYT